MAHTPEPWQMTCGYVREVDGCHDLSVFITAGRFIAEVAYNDPEQEANARLIHVAPKLLTMLKETAAELDAIMDQKGHTAQTRAIRDRAYALIAKVKGEQ